MWVEPNRKRVKKIKQILFLWTPNIFQFGMH